MQLTGGNYVASRDEKPLTPLDISTCANELRWRSGRTPFRCGFRECPDILGAGGELYSIKLDGGLYDDWQAELSSKGGDRIGLFLGDVDGDAWQVLSGNFTRPCGGVKPHDASRVVSCTDGRNGRSVFSTRPYRREASC